MQTMSHNLLLLCAPTWPSHHVVENHLLKREAVLYIADGVGTRRDVNASRLSSSSSSLSSSSLLSPHLTFPLWRVVDTRGPQDKVMFLPRLFSFLQIQNSIKLWQPHRIFLKEFLKISKSEKQQGDQSLKNGKEREGIISAT